MPQRIIPLDDDVLLILYTDDAGKLTRATTVDLRAYAPVRARTCKCLLACASCVTLPVNP
jgi:hypothetical protein